MKREGFESQPVGEGNCSQEKQGKGSRIPAGILVHCSSCRDHSFLLLFPSQRFGSAVMDSAPCVSCWRRWQPPREVAAQWTSSKYLFGGKCCICQQSSAVSLPSIDLLSSTTFWSVELAITRSAVEGLFFCLDGRGKESFSTDKCHPAVLERIHSTFLSLILLSFCHSCPRIEGKKK